MKYKNISKAGSEIKRKLLIALLEGKIKKGDLTEIDSSLDLLKGDGTDSLFKVTMGDNVSYNINGRKIDQEEHAKLSKILTALGDEPEIHIANWGFDKKLDI
jgi:hypothetical protein